MKNDMQKKDMKPVLMTGVILILVAGLVGFLILLNFHYTEKLADLRAQNQNNAQRLSVIENFLNQQYQAAQQMQLKQQNQQPADGEE